jgi:hypothetical protein
LAGVGKHFSAKNMERILVYKAYERPSDCVEQKYPATEDGLMRNPNPKKKIVKAKGRKRGNRGKSPVRAGSPDRGDDSPSLSPKRKGTKKKKKKATEDEEDD